MIQITCLINNEVVYGPPVWGEHGLSWLIATSQSQVILDTGHSPEVLAHNLAVLKKPLDKLSHVILSHGHYDHTGGLSYLLNENRNLKVVASPKAFEPRYNTQSTPPRSIGIPLVQSEIQQRAQLILQEQVMEVAPGMTVLGAIPRLTDFEKMEPELTVKRDGLLIPDPFEDDRAMVIETAEGVILLLGCAHAGLVNTLYETRRLFARPIVAVMGGSHLIHASPDRLQRTITVLAQTFPEIQTLRFNHCTGGKALFALRAALGERVQPFLAGETLEFEER